MNTPRIQGICLAAAAVASLLAAGFLNGAQDRLWSPRTVHADVEWQGENAGKLVDDERVRVLREHLVQLYAARNALNYSDPALTAVTRRALLDREALDVVRELSGNAIPFPRGSVSQWDGPPSFSVLRIGRPREPVGPRHHVIYVCQKLAPRWTASDAAINDDGTEVEEHDGLYRIKDAEYNEFVYEVTWAFDRWWVNSLGGGVSDVYGYGIYDEPTCDPGEVATGTYTTRPDLDLLRRAIPEMAVDSYGRSGFDIESDD